jgi:plastocyanin
MYYWKMAVPPGAVAIGALLFAATPEVRSAAGTTGPAPAAISIDNFAFTPPTLTVSPGTTVTWTNADDEAHTVVEKERKFKSAALDTDDTFSQTFTVPGEYEYICSIHPYMAGKIVVKPGA